MIELVEVEGEVTSIIATIVIAAITASRDDFVLVA